MNRSDPVSSLGEGALIHRFLSKLDTRARAFVVGVGDDAAVVRPESDLVVTTDVAVEGIHFRSDWFGWSDAGYRSFVGAVSDVWAMGGHPTWATIALGLPPDLAVSDMDAIADGIRDAQRDTGVPLAGGDTTRSPVVFIAVTVGGACSGRPFTRAGARAGDRVIVAGTLGAPCAALIAFSRGGVVESERDDAMARVRTRLMRPAPDPEAVERLRACDVGAVIDISDGLIRDAGHVASASGVGIDLDADAIPVDTDAARVCANLKVDALDCALNSGEEYRLLATIRDASVVPEGWIEIGRCVGDREGVWLRTPSGLRPADEHGWDHFRGVSTGQTGNSAPTE